MMINSDNIYHDYTIHKKLGRGAFGSVYLSTHKRTGLERAVKKIAKSNLEDPSRMLEEVEILMDLVRVI
jgi:calcium-dependent protein kinase